MKNKILASIAIAATVIGITVIANWQQIAKGEICDKNEYSNQKECPQYKAGSFIFMEITRSLDHHEGAVVGLGTIFVAIFTCLLSVFTWRLWSATDKLVREARITAERQLRAYMGQAQTITDFAHARVLMYVRNEGETPAYNVIISAYCSTKEPTTIEDLTYQTSPQLLQRLQGYEATIPLGPEATTAIPAGLIIYVYCEIDYMDTFNRLWKTIVCMEKHPGDDRWRPYKNHNAEKCMGKAKT